MSDLMRFSGFQAVAEKPRIILPRGGYIAQILAAKLEPSSQARQRLVFKVEIVEGPYKDYYHLDYAARKDGFFDAKYRGTYSILYPLGNGTEEDQLFVDRFNLTMGAITSSNPGYEWDWNLQSLKGRFVGLSVRENEYDGIVSTEIGKFIPTDIIRSGCFRPMRRRIGQEQAATAAPVPQGLLKTIYPINPQKTAPIGIPQIPVSRKPASTPASSSAEINDDDCPF